jgi:hypothetical protein
MADTLKDVTVEQLEAAWAEIFDEARRSELMPGEKTSDMVVEETGLSFSSVRRMLSDETRFEKRPVLVNGKAGFAYKPIVEVHG